MISIVISTDTYISINNFIYSRTTYSDDIALIKLDTSIHGEPNIPEEIELQTEPIETSRDLSKAFKKLSTNFTEQNY